MITIAELRKSIGKHIGAVANGHVLLIQKYGRVSAVIVPPELWADWTFDGVWSEMLTRLREKFPGKTDGELFRELLQRWDWEQRNGKSKGAVLNEIREDVKCIKSVVCEESDHAPCSDLDADD